ncbi:MAG: ribosomal-processing cysteine protease Prp [Selenomonadaceae bacterium]|nr:ribosomal-processing cysteine protease Prp [Selenomonadaceae bacterium]
MIRAEIYSDGERITGFSILGHSGTAPRGHDIYCAGVSALSQSAYLALVEHLGLDVDMKQASGKFIVMLKGEPTDLTEAVFQVMLLGLIEIEKIKPEALKIDYDDNGFRGE